MLPKSLGLLAEPGPARDLWTTAAVRERFQIDTLLTDWFTAKGTVSPAEENTAITTALDLKELAAPSLDGDGKDALKLGADLRYKVLQSIGVDAATRALAAIPPEQATGAETLFKSLLAGEPGKPDSQDREVLYQLSTVADWAGAVGARLDFDPQELRQSLQQRDFIESLGGPDLHRFVGRKQQLGQLRQLWLSHHKSSVALIEAPGGMGKSLLIGQFVSELQSLPPSQAPNAVFHLDFDRRELQSARPATLMAELVRQARHWVAASRIPQLDELEQDLSFGPGLEASGNTRSGESYVNIADLARRLVDLLRLEPQLAPRLLVVVDSFEQVIGFDDVASHSPAEVCEELVSAGGADVLTIYASRTFPGDQFAPAPNARRISLTALSARDATHYLETEGRRLNRSLTKTTVRQIQNAVGRSPLALRLAMSLLSKEDGKIDPAQWVARLRDSPERIQAALYDRILKRVRDLNLRKVAMPGLLVRRLTEEVIARILAGPCQLDLSETSPRALMDAAVDEGQLFQRKSSDPDALWHRADVRALMLPDIDATVPKAIAEQINYAAIDYYSRADDVASRTEELYHRLRLDQPGETITPRWTKEAGEALRPALPELPSRARALVRSSLGGASIERTRAVGRGAAAAPSVNLEDLRGIARRYLQRGMFSEMSNTLKQHGLDRLDGPLGDVYAESLVAQGRQRELIAGVDAVDARLPGNRPLVSAGVLSAAAAVLEGRKDLQQACLYWDSASRFDLEQGGDELMLQLSIRIGVLRVERKLARLERRPVGLEEAFQLAIKLGSSMMERAVLVRETVAELLELLQQDRSERIGFLRELLASLLRTGEAFPSCRGDKNRLAQIGRQLIGQSVQFVDELSGYAEKLSYGPPEAISSLISILRDEVDWTLERAALRGLTHELPARS